MNRDLEALGRSGSGCPRALVTVHLTTVTPAETDANGSRVQTPGCHAEPVPVEPVDGQSPGCLLCCPNAARQRPAPPRATGTLQPCANRSPSAQPGEPTDEVTPCPLAVDVHGASCVRPTRRRAWEPARCEHPKIPSAILMVPTSPFQQPPSVPGSTCSGC